MHNCEWTRLVDKEIESAYMECANREDYSALHRTRALTTAVMSVHFALHDIADLLAAQANPDAYVGGTAGS